MRSSGSASRSTSRSRPRASLISQPPGSQTYALDAFLATDGTKVPSTDTVDAVRARRRRGPVLHQHRTRQKATSSTSARTCGSSLRRPRMNGTPVPGGPGVRERQPGRRLRLRAASAHLAERDLLRPRRRRPVQLRAARPGGGADRRLVGDPVHRDFNHVPAARREQLPVRDRPGPPARLAGAAGAANDVRVFFRLWSTQTADTDYQTASTYPSTTDAAGFPGRRRSARATSRLPFFASGNLGREHRLRHRNGRQHPGPGRSPPGMTACGRTSGASSTSMTARTSSTASPCKAGSTAPITAWSPRSPTTAPRSSPGRRPEALGQARPAQPADDPFGQPRAGRPRTASRKPSTLAPARWTRRGAVDELMIDWGHVPAGSVASIFWPQVDAGQVVDLAVVDVPAHTPHRGRRTHDPLRRHRRRELHPDPGTGRGELRGPVHRRSAAPRCAQVRSSPSWSGALGHKANRILEFRRHTGRSGGGAGTGRDTWRYVIGTFTVKIPVVTAETMLLPEENTLAIMRWRLASCHPRSLAQGSRSATSTISPVG